MGIGTFRFLLDNTVVTNPKGFDEAQIKIKRDDNLNALFYEYVTDLVFIGDGYDYLINKIESDGYCEDIYIRIEKSCSDNDGYYNLFEGYIKLDESKVDEYVCEITVNAENNTLAQQIINFSENEFYIETNKGMGWVVSPPTIQNTGFVQYNDISTSFNANTYKVIDVFQFLIDCMTKGTNQITVVSDYFTVDTPLRQITTVKYNSPGQLLGVGTNTIVYTNYFGEQITATAPQQATTVCALENLMYYLRGDTTATDARNEYYENDFRKPQRITSNGTDTLTIESDFPFTIDNVYQGFNIPQNHTITTTQSVKDGMKYLALTNGALLRGVSTLPPKLSFKKLFNELDSQFNLGMSIKNVNGIITMRIEPIIYFFGSSNSITIENVPNLTYELSKRFSINQLSVGDSSDSKSRRADLNNNNTWFSGSNCQANKKDCKNDFCVNWDDIITQLNQQLLASDLQTDKFDEKIFLIECEKGSNDLDAIQYIDKTTKFVCGLTEITGYVMNTHLTNYWKIRRWLFNCLGDMQWGSKLITNHNTYKPLKEYSFEYPLTFEQLQLLRDNETDFIIFGKDELPQNYKYGWVEDINYKIKTGLTSFKLIST